MHPFVRPLILALSFGALAVAACVDDAPGDLPTTPDGADAAPQNPGADSSTDGAGNSDASLVCAKDLGNCDGDVSNGCETSLVTPDNCGACGRACGGSATCVQGKCTAETLSMTLDHPFGFALAGARAIWMSPSAVFACTLATCATSTAIMVDVETTTNNPVPNGQFSARQIAVDGTTFYYEKCPMTTPNTDCAPAACPVTGCKSGGSVNGSTLLKASSGYRRSTMLVLGVGAVYTYNGLDGVQQFSIPIPSTNTSPLLGVMDYFGGIHVDAQHIVWLSDDPSTANPTGGVFVCPASGCAGGPGPTLLAPPLRLLTYGASALVTTTGGSSNLANAAVTSCAVTGCGGAGTTLAQNQAYISDIIADDKDVYWATVGAPSAITNTAPVGTIMRCSMPTCAGGPEKIADQVVNPVGLALDSDDVYWITYGTGASQNGTLVRQRR